MALYTKQDFNPPILSRRWVVMKIRPNMLLYSRQHVISILESGLLFREDSVEVEQEAQWEDERGRWLTTGERVVGAMAVTAVIALAPPQRLNRTTLLQLAAYLSIPLAVRAIHRRACRGTLQLLLLRMRDYLALARRAAACLKECAAFRAQLISVSSVLESMHTLLCRQQSALAVTLARASSALLGNAPWLRADLAWEALPLVADDNLMKIHHALLVVQSTLLKHIALAHCTPPAQATRLYRNHNERIHWMHAVLMRHLAEEFRQNYESLERMYRLLKNYGECDTSVSKKPGTAIQELWMYSDVHSGIARTNLELKLSLNKCNELDQFLDSCALNKQKLDLDLLNKDIDGLIDQITKCLATAQNSQIRLKKLQTKFGAKTEVAAFDNEEEIEDDKPILKIEDREPETRDEVFYFVKTDDDDRVVQSSGDISTAPGKREKEATKMVLNELRRKLVRREDAMRERERQALAKTMHLTEQIPEFPRQINMEEFAERKGYITKLPKRPIKKRLFHNYKIKPQKTNGRISTLRKLTRKKSNYENDIELKESSSTLYETNSKTSLGSKLLTFDRTSDTTIVTEWYKSPRSAKDDDYDLSEGLSDVEAGTANKNVNQAINFEADLPVNTIKNKNSPDNAKNEEAENNRQEAKNNKQEAKSIYEVKNQNHGARNNNDGVKNANSEAKNMSHEARNYKFSKRDLEWSSSSENESDFELYKEQQLALLKDIRRFRAARKKNHPDKRANQPSETMDEGLRPTEYSFGAGLAMASVLQVNGSGALGLRPPMQEEQFIGDGEVSPDSGNDVDT